MSNLSNLTETFAEFIIRNNLEGNYRRCECFAEWMYEDMPLGHAEPTEEEGDIIMKHLTMAAEELEPKAMEPVEEWNRDAREEYQEREEARRGQY